MPYDSFTTFIRVSCVHRITAHRFAGSQTKLENTHATQFYWFGKFVTVVLDKSDQVRGLMYQTMVTQCYSVP